VERRRFNTLLGAAGLSVSSPDVSSAAGSGSPAGPRLEPEVLRLKSNGWVPNNERLPVLLYRSVLTAGGSDPASIYEDLFTKHGWPPQWRDGVYNFHHYHSTAHEVLGFARGQARLVLGGDNGQELDVSGRRRCSASRDGTLQASCDAGFHRRRSVSTRSELGHLPDQPLGRSVEAHAESSLSAFGSGWRCRRCARQIMAAIVTLSQRDLCRVRRRQSPSCQRPYASL